MRRALFFLVCLSGCVDRDPCAGHDGACLGLRVLGSGRIDQLRVMLDGAAQLDAVTPAAPGPAHDLPVTTAVFLPPVSGQIAVGVTGLLMQTPIGEAHAQVTVRRSQHLLLTLTLGASGGDLGMQDLAALDLAGRDLAGLDLAGFDLASVDQSMPSPDLEGDDLLSTGDLAGTGPRRVFALPARSPLLGALSSLDNECSTTADSAGLGNHYLAIISYPGMNAGDRITLGQGRDVDVPSGRQVATDATFFSYPHLSGIDELADGTPVTGCVFTTFDPTGHSDVTSVAGDCAGWSSNAMTDTAYYGDVSATDFGWSFSNAGSCDMLTCHIYCIEQ